MLPHEELADKAISQREKQKAKAKVAYAYARQLGFTTFEAQIMAKWSLARIEQYAKGKASSEGQ